MRKLSVAAPDLASVSAATGSVITELDIGCITPLFGGGVASGAVEEHHPVNAKNVRGHLRFWWRACNAGAHTSTAAMREVEARYWGKASKPNQPGFGAIDLDIDLDVGQQRLQRFEGSSNPQYALFGFKSNDQHGVIGVRFTLRLRANAHVGTDAGPTLAECTHAATQALWAWLTFGGYGSRTRRGLGALRVDASAEGSAIGVREITPPATVGELGGWLRGRMDTLVAPPEPGSMAGRFPSLSGARIGYRASLQSHMDAWPTAIRMLSDFTQGTDIGRNGVRGQSRWRDVSAARRLLRDNNLPYAVPRDTHTYEIVEHRNVTARDFARADLGLPRTIRLGLGKGAPTVQLERNEDEFTRQPSTIVLKPLAVTSDQSVAMALFLNAPHPWDGDTPLRATLNEDRTVVVPYPSGEPAGHPPDWPFATKPPLFANAVPSARDAFWRFLAQEGWKPV